MTLDGLNAPSMVVVALCVACTEPVSAFGIGTLLDSDMAVETQTMPALNGHTNGDVQMHDVAEGNGVRFSSGLILPPPEIKCEF